ncbi:MAG: hypothetical protein OEY59_14015 [Deltaproteobacteria bacterium]|nr:hypothetical protein [Deltaproteobacteria bacterium]
MPDKLSENENRFLETGFPNTIVNFRESNLARAPLMAQGQSMVFEDFNCIEHGYG